MNQNFPYSWINTPNVNPLLAAMIKKDFKTAENLIKQGAEIADIDKATFQRALFEFLNDYETMRFLIKHKFKPFYYYGRVECQDEYGRLWGIIARVYFCRNKQVLELLLSVGFDYFSEGAYWGSDGKRYVLWKWVLLNGNDREFVDLLLSYGTLAKDILDWIDDPDYEPHNYGICSYLKSNPNIVWKGYALASNRFGEIPLPKRPYIGIFTSKRKKEFLEAEYERQMEEYRDKKRVQQEFLNSITQDDWKAIESMSKREIEVMQARKMLVNNLCNKNN